MTATQIVTKYIKAGYPYSLAIHKVSEETGTPTREIADELLKRKQRKNTARNAKAKYQSTVPAWIQKQNQMD